jgi:hypothetical protein
MGNVLSQQQGSGYADPLPVSALVAPVLVASCGVLSPELSDVAPEAKKVGVQSWNG